MNVKEAPENWYVFNEEEYHCAAAWKRQYEAAMEMLVTASTKIRTQSEEIDALIKEQNRLRAIIGSYKRSAKRSAS